MKNRTLAGLIMLSLTFPALAQPKLDFLGRQVAEMGCMAIYTMPSETGNPRTLNGDLRDPDKGDLGIYFFEHGDRAIYVWAKNNAAQASSSDFDGSGYCYKFERTTGHLECKYEINYRFDRQDEHTGEYYFKFYPTVNNPNKMCVNAKD